MQTNRILSSEFGSAIDRSQPLTFMFDGRRLTGFAGDTVASALLANNIHLVARSIKFHRPRGILSCGVEEPSAILECTAPGINPVPNLKATEVLLSEGLTVKSQNNWPSRNFDAFELLSFGSRFLQAGFYYKTFLWPRFGWHRWYEKIIRNFAGAGRIHIKFPGADVHSTDMDQRYKYCQILIIGSGPAGINAALTCARKGIHIVLVEQETNFGGSLLWRTGFVGSIGADQWISEALDELRQCPHVTLLSHTLAFGHYDHGMVFAYQSGELAESGIFWKIRSERILLASGAIERPLVFPNNDRPGIMLAGAVRKYLNRYAVRPGQRAFVAVADEEEKEATVSDCVAAGIEVTACLESGQQIVDVGGRRRVRSVAVKTTENKIIGHACDLVCVSGGWTPTVHLAAHMHSKLPLDEKAQTFTAPKQSGPLLALGASRGVYDLDLILKDSEFQAQKAMFQIGIPNARADNEPVNIEHFPVCPGWSEGKNHRAFVDLQNDVTTADLAQTVKEGYRDIELVKRYTVTGMGTDQGKTSWVNAIHQISAATGESPAKIGHTTFRPPYSPIPFAGIAGARLGKHMKPVRRTPLHRVFEQMGCVFQNSGDWLYSQYFPRFDETLEQAVKREVRAVRTGVGFVDMSTLGKFEVRGRDAEMFLSRLYCNNVSGLPVGKIRYGLMLREDGIVFDDGTVTRLGDEHFVVTATTANSDAVWLWMTKLAQIQWTDLDVTATNVSEHWATIAIAGPKSREILRKLSPDIDAGRLDFPFASVRQGVLQRDVPCRIYSVSYSGELCFEVNIPAGYACSFVEQLMEIGDDFGIMPYGLEALDVLRIEKGHLTVGREIDGRTTPHDLGLGKMISNDKDFIGRSLLNRPGLQCDDRLQLVGLTAADETSVIPAGGVLAESSLSQLSRQEVDGHLTAAVCSPTLDMSIALALLRNGHRRHGEELWVVSPVAGVSTKVKVGPTCFYDVAGDRLNG